MTTRADRRGVLRRGTLTRQALPFSLDRYTVAELPDAARWEGAQVHVSDEIDGAVTCFSDGTDWRRITDRVVASAAVPTALSAAGASDSYLHAVIGPYLSGNGAATGTLAGASVVAVGASAAGVGAMTLQTPPKAPTDLSGAGSGTATATGASYLSPAISGAGVATGTLYGEAA